MGYKKWKKLRDIFYLFSDGKSCVACAKIVFSLCIIFCMKQKEKLHENHFHIKSEILFGQWTIHALELFIKKAFVVFYIDRIIGIFCHIKN